MAERPYTVLSCAMSLDGYIDSPEARPLTLSSPADLERVDAVRAHCDAILVGAATVRQDDPRLRVRSPARRAARRAAGRPDSPTRVTVTGTGRLPASARFFAPGDGDPLVYCGSAALGPTRARLAGRATVLDAGQPVDLGRMSEDLHQRGVRRLMVEGGGQVHTQFLTGDLADELQLVVAPFFVGDAAASRFVGPGRFPFDRHRRATLAQVSRLQDVVLLRYALSPRFCPADPEETR